MIPLILVGKKRCREANRPPRKANVKVLVLGICVNLGSIPSQNVWKNRGILIGFAPQIFKTETSLNASLLMTTRSKNLTGYIK